MADTPKIVLICEDYESGARALSRYLKTAGYTPFTLAKNNDPNYVVSKIEETVIRCQPDYIILDGLNGLCVQGAEIAKNAKPDISVIVISGEENIIKKARSAGHKVFDKNYDYFDDLCKFLER